MSGRLIAVKRRQTTIEEERMGHVHVKVGIASVTGGTFRYYTALIDTGATKTILPASIAKELGIEKGEAMSVMTGNGPVTLYESLARMKIEGINADSPIWISDQMQQVIVGVLTLESAGLSVDPKNKKLKKEELLFYAAA